MKFKLLCLRVSSNIIDFGIIYTVSLIANMFVLPDLGLNFLKILIVFTVIYFPLFYLLIKTTPGKYLLQIRLTSVENRSLTFTEIMKREFLIKYLTGILLPYVILLLFKWTNFNKIIIAVFLIMVILSIFIWFLKKESWWDFLAKTRVERILVPKKNVFYSFLSLFLFFVITFSFIIYSNNTYQNSDLKMLGFSYPVRFKRYPNNARVKEYTNFLNKQKLSPKEYIFELFKSHDIVILCEASHLESTAWDLISDIVSDERFIDNVGNIFTEYGDASAQSKLDSILFTRFSNDSILEKSLASLMSYRGPHFFYFLKKLNLINSSLPDSMKIHEYFTDLCHSCDYFPNNSVSTQLDSRDSIMAHVVINRFRNIQKTEHRKKSLVITNYRHAFEDKRNMANEKGIFNFCEAHFIFRAFPDKTANVMLNSLTYNSSVIPVKDKFALPDAIQNGKWDRAFEENNNEPLGFDFRGSPFGQDNFDYWLLPNSLTYSDVFTGFIFNIPYYKWEIKSTYPYMKYGAEIEYRRKNKGTHIEVDMQRSLNYINSIKTEEERNMRIVYGLLNFLPYFFYFLTFVTCILIIVYHFIRLIFTKPNVPLQTK